jgi:hypothetical protein
MYTVDIADIASGWVTDGSQNFGVAITDDPSNTSTAYQVVFGPPSAISNMQATVEFTPPAAGTAQIPTDTGSAAPIGNPTGDLSTGVATPSVPSTPLLPVNTNTGSPPLTAAPPQPVSTGPASRPARITPIRYPAATSTPPLGFWVVGVVLAALVGMCMLELRRTPGIPAAAGERGVGRLLSRLAEQQQGASTGVGPEIRRTGDEKLA